MPYMIQPNGDGKFCVYKQGANGEPEGESLKCHPSRRLAQKHLKALYANVRETCEAREERRNRQIELAHIGKHEPDSIEKAEDSMPSNLTIEVDGEQIAVDALVEAWKTLQEQKVKTVGGKKFPASDFLVAEDPESPSTWHLQVKNHGKADRRLMGAAKAALTSPGGHRGQKYAGPDKAGALRKLKALYKSEGMDFGEAAADATDVEAEEDYGGPDSVAVVSVGPTTFTDLIARKQAREAADEVYELTYQFQMLANNVMSSPDIEDKVAALKALAAEYVAMIEAAMADVPSPEMPGATEETATETQPAQDDLAESESGQAVQLVEVADGPPAVVDVEVIQPGWGNARDNHYYPAEVLERDKGVFKGAKMYATDHRPDQKSVLTEVSTILDIVGVSEKGAPIARVGVHNPEFAADVRNRARLGVLSELHCSILAKGTAKDFERDGRKGKLVESITSVQSVDWVTRAGAGGHAVALVENEPTATNESTSTEGIVIPVEQEPVAEASATDTAQPVTISEAEQAAAGTASGRPAQAVNGLQLTAATAAATPADTTASAEAAAPAAPAAQEAWLSEADVTAELGKRPALHPAIKAHVAAVRYHDLAELGAALDAEIAYYKQLTGSGQPFAQGTAAQPKPMTSEELEEQGKQGFNRIMRKYGAREV